MQGDRDNDIGISFDRDKKMLSRNAPMERSSVIQCPDLGQKADFKMCSDFTPAGDQPQAIKALAQGLAENKRNQVLMGVTGSGKTFSMAHVIAKRGTPCLILAPNKTLAAQLYGEMKSLFPDNGVCYFVSYYDYYQPEAYVASSDTYIEKESSINEQIDRLRHEATRSLFERRDVIIVASVSCIYGIGDPQTYAMMTVSLSKGMEITRDALLRQLVELQYRRNDHDFRRGFFRVRGDSVEIFPSHYEDKAWRLSFFGDEVEEIAEIDPLTGKADAFPSHVRLYGNSHYVTTKPALKQAIVAIREELTARLVELKSDNRLIEAQRLEERTQFDLEMIEATGSCPGIENYSRHLTGRPSGSAPPTLFEYLPDDALVIVDESHVSVPQLRAMFKGDQSRKRNLSDYGFRLPSCLDNRPLQFEEWDRLRTQTIFVSATPGPWEMKQLDSKIIEQLIRPTGLTDPVCVVRPALHQVDDLMKECRDSVKRGHRVLVTTLTKRMAEDLTEYLFDAGLRVRYMHSDIDTLERIEIIRDLRLGTFDILIGINLLREGLDIPECALVAVLDADKEGFLRSRTSLIQTIGRAARNIDGKVILYADTMTDSLKAAIEETDRRRERQELWNTRHSITPQSVKKSITDIMGSVYAADSVTVDIDGDKASRRAGVADPAQMIKDTRRAMLAAAEDLDFEEAAKLRDRLRELEHSGLSLPPTNTPTYGRKSRRRRTR